MMVKKSLKLNYSYLHKRSQVAELSRKSKLITSYKSFSWDSGSMRSVIVYTGVFPALKKSARVEKEEVNSK